KARIRKGGRDGPWGPRTALVRVHRNLGGIVAALVEPAGDDDGEEGHDRHGQGDLDKGGTLRRGGHEASLPTLLRPGSFAKVSLRRSDSLSRLPDPRQTTAAVAFGSREDASAYRARGRAGLASGRRRAPRQRRSAIGRRLSQRRWERHALHGLL